MQAPPEAAWTPEAIRAAIRARGVSVEGFARRHGLHPKAVANSLRKRHPKENRIVSAFLGQPMHVLWPSWYATDGSSLDRRKHFAAGDAYERILARVAAGEKVDRICAEPGAPSRGAILRHRRRNPDFAARWSKAIGRRSGIALPPDEIADAAEWMIERLAAGGKVEHLAPHAPLPRRTIERHVMADPEKRERWRAALGQRPGIKISDKRLDAVVSALRSGESYRSQGIVSASTVWRTKKLDEDFAKRLTNIRSMPQQDVFSLVDAAVPKGLPSFMRDEIRGDVTLQLLAGEISSAGIKNAVREAMRGYNRTFGRRDVSFDADLGDGFTLAGVVSDGSFDVGESGIRVQQVGW